MSRERTSSANSTAQPHRPRLPAMVDLRRKGGVTMSEVRDVMNRAGEEFMFDYEAELVSLCAAMIAPLGVAKKLLRSASAGVFGIPEHRWLWKKVCDAVLIQSLDIGDPLQLAYAMRRGNWVREFRSAFRYPLGVVIEQCLNSGFWWHGPYYLDRVVTQAKRRQRVETIARQLREVIDQ